MPLFAPFRFKFLFLLLIFASLFKSTLGQNQVLRGQVLDAETKEPLPFVNVVYTEKGTGTATNLNGYFSIPVSENLSNLRFSYVGYEILSISLEDKDLSKLLIAELQKKSFEIEEVRIYPGINPAHRIIMLALENRDLNNPEKMRSFSYKSYNKMVFTFEKDTTQLPAIRTAKIESIPADSSGIEIDSIQISKTDSSKIRLQNFLERQDLFIMESVSQREYLYPGRNNEVVLASRVSGFQEPSFVLLATQLQSFSFYEELITISDQRYLNPISRGSTSRYSFILEDSLFTAENDTVFVISFRPYNDRNFQGLKGLLNINSRGYAIQSVIAEPAEKGKFFSVKIQQNYKLVDNRQWFPVELNTEIHFPNMRANNTHYALGKGRSYLSDISLTPDLPRRNFSHIELRVDPNAHQQSDEFWNQLRAEPLTEKNIVTYQRIDSIGQTNRFDRGLRTIETLASGFIPAGIFNIDYTSLLDYNMQEGARAGLHLKTNQKVSSRFSIGGKFAYGFGDKVIKYGGYGELLIYRPYRLTLGVYHSYDTKEAGGYSFLIPSGTFSSESSRRFVLQNLDYVTENEIRLKFQGLQYFSGELSVTQSRHETMGDYRFFSDEEWINKFSFFETGIRLRYAYKEKFFQTPKGEKISLGTKAPVLYVNVSKGFDNSSEEFRYLRTVARISQSITKPKTGTSSLTIEAGNISGEVPVSKLFFGRSSYASFSMEAENSFGTMRMNEFLNRDFVNVFFRHNFHSLLFKKGKFSPQIVAVTNIGWGSFGSGSNHQGLHYKTMEKGYFESGILINNIFNQLFLGYGAGLYYRYGPYAFNKTIDNFAFKLTFTVNL
jgi:hypothetical protein